MSSPQAMISYSDDFGRSFSAEIVVDLVGDAKNYLNRIRLYGLGSSFNRIFRVRCSDNISFTLVAMHGDLEFGL